jgi:hypothetical protein
MTLDKAIAHGKEHRKPYRGAKAVDRTCRNHGSCPACQRSRRRKEKALESVRQVWIDVYMGEE